MRNPILKKLFSFLMAVMLVISLIPASVMPTRAVTMALVASVSPDIGAAAGGDTITIMGSGFTGATAVRFGTENAIWFRVDSDTQITAITPAVDIGTVSVYVDTTFGTKSLASCFEYRAAAYGYAYNLVENAANATVAGNNYIMFPNYDSVLNKNIQYDAGGSRGFIINEAGQYLIEYGVNITDCMSGGSIAVAVNDSVVDSTVVDLTAVTGEISGTAILTLSANDTVFIKNNTADSFTLAQTPGTGAYLKVTEIETTYNTSTYGYFYSRYNNMASNVICGADFIFEHNGPSYGIAHTEWTSAVTIPEDGTYLVGYKVNTARNSAGGQCIAVAVNGMENDSTALCNSSMFGYEFSGCALITLLAGDCITLRNTMMSQTVECAGVSMTLIKLDKPAAYFYTDRSSLNAGSKIEFSSGGYCSGIENNFATGGEATVLQGGVYSVDYNVNVSNGSEGIIAASVNDSSQDSTKMRMAGTTGTLTLSSILNLLDQSDVTLMNDSLYGMDLEWVAGKSAQMVLIKLSDDIEPFITGLSPSSGLPAGGESVTISGDYFTDDSKVLFGNTLLEGTDVTYNSPESLTVTAPAGTGDVRVRVITPSGVSGLTGTASKYTYASGDTTAPTLSLTSASDVAATTAKLNFTSDEAGTYYYLVYAATETAPDAATVKTQGTAAAKGTGNASAAANSASMTGLVPLTAYKAYVIVEDAAHNVSGVGIIEFTTTDGVIPLTSSVTAFASGVTYTIENTEQLNRLGTLVRQGKSGAGATFILTNDIVFGYWHDVNGNGEVDDGEIYDAPSGGSAYTATNYTAIGKIMNSFSGTFDGNGHTVSGMYAKNESSSSNIRDALFVGVDGGTVKNVGIQNSFIQSCRSPSAIVNDLENSTMENCYAASTVTIVGVGVSVGGLVEYCNSSTIQYCYNMSRVKSIGTVSYIGGIVGEVRGTNSLIQYCYNTGDITPEASYHGVGGITGLLGDASAILRNCYNTGNVTGTGDSFGGIVGTSGGLVENCYNAGFVSATAFAGNIVGTDANVSVTTGCYYDSNICAIGGVRGSDVPGGAEGKTSAEMTAGNPFAGWDTGVWSFSSGRYPKITALMSNDVTAPILTSASVSNSTSIVVELSEDCLNLSKMNGGGFTVTETGGSVTYAVTNTVGGANAHQIVLTVDNMIASGRVGVTVSYEKGVNGTITDTAGNAMETNSAGVTATAWDLDGPTMISASRTSDTLIIVELSEDSLNLTKTGDGGFTVTETSGSATYAITATSQGSDAHHILLSVESIAASGCSGVTVTYVKGTSGTITDLAGNEMVTDDAGAAIAVWDTGAPVVSGVGDGVSYNTDVTPTFSETVATLSKDGMPAEPFVSNTPITEEGSYVLTVSNTSGNSTVIHFSIDKTNPVLGNINLDAVTSAGAKLDFTSSEAASYYILVCPAEDPIPTADAVREQVYGPVARITGTASIVANNINVTGLIAGSDYAAYVLLEDAAGNRSDVKTVSLTTTDQVIPLISSVATLESGITYTIDSAEQLNHLGTLVKAGQSGAGATFMLTEDIVFGYWRDDVIPNAEVDDGEIYNASDGGTAYTATNYTPIGNLFNHFSGTFDGRNHMVSGMYSNNTSSDGVNLSALFGSVDGGTVRNVGVQNSYLYGYKDVAGVVGSLKYGTVENCHTDASVSIVGLGFGIGGVVGYSDSSTIQYCYNMSRVRSIGTVNYIGGIVGEVWGPNSLIQCCYNTGDITPEADYHGTGGITGLLSDISGTIRNCYNTGDVTGTGDSFSGIVGTSWGLVENCYNTGFVSATFYLSNIVGTDANVSVTKGCYYDSDVCAAIGGVRGSDVPGGAEGKTSAEMISGSAFAGWDTDIWRFEAGSYPKITGFLEFENTPPTISSVSRESDTEITVELSEACRYLTRTNDGGFTVTETDGSATYAVTGTAKGIDASHVVLTVADMAASGDKGVTVTYTKGTNGTIADMAYNTLKTNGTGFTIDAWDTTPPEVNGVIDGEYYNESVTPTFTEGTATLKKGTGNAETYVSDTAITEEGTYVLTATDAAGNSTVIRFTIDKTAPEVGGVTDETFYHADVTPTFTEGTATLKKDSGNAETYTSETPVTEEGVYVLTVTDTAGNKTVIHFTIDKTDPTIVGAIRKDDGDTEITVELSEDCKNMAKTNDGGFTVTETGGTTTYAVSGTAQGDDASHIVLTVANIAASGRKGVTVTYTEGTNGTIADLAGNTLKTNTTGAAIAAWDTTPPTVNGVTDGTYYNTNVTPTFTEGTATLQKDSGNANTYTSNKTITEEGVYILTVTDVAGNSAVIHFTIDKTAPEVSGVTDGAGYNKNVTPTFTEGSATLKKDSNSPQTYASGTLVSEDGSYVLTVTDLASNSTVIHFTIDKTAPVLSNEGANPITGAGASLNFTSSEAGTYYYLVCPAADSVPNTQTVKAQGYGPVAKGTGEAVASGNSISVTGLIASKAYKAYVIVEDAADNISSVKTIELTAANDKMPLSSATALESGMTYTIANAAELNKLGDFVNSGQTGAGATFVLIDDITFGCWQDKDHDGIVDDGEIYDAPTDGSAYTAVNYTMIGDFMNVFSGMFDGRGHTIRGMYNNTTDLATYSTLFGSVTDGTVRNVVVAESYIQGGMSVSALVGDCVGSTVENCYTDSSVHIVGLWNSIGGIVGYCCSSDTRSSTIQFCYNLGTVSGIGEAYYIGGIVGLIAETNALVQYCYNAGSVSGEDGCFNGSSMDLDVGGIVGSLWDSSIGSTIRNCYNTGSVKGNGLNVGGIAGSNWNAIGDCYNAGEVTGSPGNVGGIAGYNVGTVTGCYYDNAVCTVGGIDGSDLPSSAEGKPTNWMKAGTAFPDWGTDVWSFIAGKYPEFFGFLVFDTEKPTVEIASAAAEYTNTSPIAITITFSEDVLGFASSDLSVINGSVTDFTGSGKNYTAKIIPTADGEVTADIAAGAVCDASDNGNAAATQFTRIYDTTAPATPTVASDKSVTSDTTPTWTWTTGGGGKGTFRYKLDNNDLTSGATETAAAAYTPSAALSDSDHTLYVQERDEAGNWSTAGSYKLTIDGTAPTVTITSTAAAYTNTSPIPVTITFSENVTNFEASDITIGNGAVTDFTGSGKDYTAKITPTADGEVTVDIAAGTSSDAAGNGSTAAAPLKRTYDGTAPTVTIASAAAAYTNTSPIAITITFSEDVSEFELSDLSVVNGSVTDFSGSGKDYTANIVPTADGQVTADIAAGAVPDAAGNENTAAEQFLRIYDTTVPAVNGVITVDSYTYSTVDLSWGVGTDAQTAQADLQYEVFYSLSDSIASIDEESNGTVAESWTANLMSATVSGLSASTTYYFNVFVKDQAGNKTVYGTVSMKTASIPSGEDLYSAVNNTAMVFVNGQSNMAGVLETQIGADGRITTTVVVDSDKLEKILESHGDGAVITVLISGNTDAALGVFTGKMIKCMENKNATIVLKSDSAVYTIPAAEIDIDSIAQQFGAGVPLSDIKVTVKIARTSDKTVGLMENAAKKGGFSIVISPIDFSISCEYKGKTVHADHFNHYVERMLAISDGADRISTGVIIEPNGTVYHVPTKIVVIDGKYYVKISSLTNSTYAVIWNPVEFTDVESHWARDAVNDMGSRMIVSGAGYNRYEPDRNITRAEFAAIIVKALGIAPECDESTFKDVSLADWYCRYIKTASEYGIINGYEDGTFRPTATITREQAMTMIARAMKITGLNVSLSETDIEELIGSFEDGSAASAYAKESIAGCLKAGIVTGKGENRIAPKECITRAEVAVIIERLLQRSGLI